MMRKRILALILTAAALLSLAGCGNQNAAPTDSGEASAAASTEAATEAPTAAPTEKTTEGPTEPPTLPEPKTREMNALREQAVAYMKSMAAVEWTPAKEFTVKNKFEEGQKYRGLPYTNVMDSSREEFLSHLENGVYTGSTSAANAVGVDCTSSTLAAWNTVITDCTAVWTSNMVLGKGYGTVMVGSYFLPRIAQNTKTIIDLNDQQTMFRAYALTLPGDALVNYTSSGHCRMVSDLPEVVYLPNGEIDGAKSFVTVTEITSSVKDLGDGIKSTWRVDQKYSFDALHSKYYIPMSTEELDVGIAQPVKFEFSKEFDGVDIVADGLPGVLKCNYRIFEVHAQVKDESGKEVAYVIKYPENNPNNSLVMSSKSYTLRALRTPLALDTLPAGKYTLTLSAKANNTLTELKTLEFTR